MVSVEGLPVQLSEVEPMEGYLCGTGRHQTKHQVPFDLPTLPVSRAGSSARPSEWQTDNVYWSVFESDWRILLLEFGRSLGRREREGKIAPSLSPSLFLARFSRYDRLSLFLYAYTVERLFARSSWFTSRPAFCFVDVPPR